jgi:hypothetical protein
MGWYGSGTVLGMVMGMVMVVGWDGDGMVIDGMVMVIGW